MAGAAGGAPAPGSLGSLEEQQSDLLCPVCFELIDEAYVTRCGHSFCYACVAKAVEMHRRCPKCGAALANRDHIFPNFVLNELVAARRARLAAGAGGGAGAGEAQRLRALLAAEARHLALRDVDSMLDVLTRRKRLLEAESAASHHRLLYEFLSALHRQRTAQLEQLGREAALVQRDLAQCGAALAELGRGARRLRLRAPDGGAGEAEGAAEDGAAESGEALRVLQHELTELADSVAHTAQPGADDAAGGAAGGAEEEESFASGGGGGDALAARWRRLTAHFDDFVQCYFAHRADELYFPRAPDAPAPAPPAPAPPDAPDAHAPAHAHAPAPAPRAAEPDADAVPQGPPYGAPPAPPHSNGGGDQRLPEAAPGAADAAPGAADAAPGAADAAPGAADAAPGAADAAGEARAGPGGLDAFRADLVAFTRYRALRPLATLSYCSDAINYSTIVSTIEFDKDEEFFAIAGVTKRIKVFEFASVVRDAVDVHYPCAEMACAHKVSCVSWNAYHKHVLASADYEGTVSLWDAHTARRTRALQEHDKRAWSVHFNRADVRLLASGSDDARVKLWALNAERSVATLEARFNVCCVRFNPRSSAHLAFGSADHCVHYYDLRAPRHPLQVFRDHRKAVSYVKFLDADTLVSASTDSALKLWRVSSPRCVRTFAGHTNEKNFVGLAAGGGGRYVACGSENNALYVYYAGLSRPLLAYRFDALRGLLAGERERRDDEPSEFVSAVCWRRARDRPALLAANSQGTIKVLELV